MNFKKFVVFVFIIMGLIFVINADAKKSADAVSGATKISAKPLSLEKITELFKAKGVFVLVSTTNKDNTPNAGYFTLRVMKDGCLMFHASKAKLTRHNIDERKVAVFSVHKTWTDEKTKKGKFEGARIVGKKIDDKAKIASLIKENGIKEKKHKDILFLTVEKIIPIH